MARSPDRAARPGDRECREHLHGKVVVAGHTFNGAAVALAAVRYDTTGALDPTFGNAGTMITPVRTRSAEARD